MAHPVPRPKSENTFQVAFLIPDEWRERADALAERLTPGVRLSRSDVLRLALGRGLDALDAEHPKTSRKR